MTLDDFDLERWLVRFRDLCLQFPGDIPLSASFGDKNAKTHFVLGAAVHGNEVGALPAFVEAMEGLTTKKLKARVTFFIGNYEAVLNNRRFNEHDLNRLLVVSTGTSSEHKRAKELMSLLETADYFIDFHQTIQPSHYPFYIFCEHPESYDFAKFLKASEVCIFEKPLPEGQASTDQFVQQRGRPALTIELGHMGLTQQSYSIAMRTISRVIQLASVGTAPAKKIAAATEVTQPLKTLKVVHQVKFSSATDQLAPGWKNMAFVKAQDVIGTRADGEPIVSPYDGYICFPKYPPRDESGRCLEKLTANLCEIAVEFQD